MGKAKKINCQPANPDRTPLLAPVQALQSLIEQFDERGVIIGGIAASLLGTPRYTADLDAVIMLDFEDIPALLDKAARFGIEPRIPDAAAFAHKSRVLLLRHTSSGIDIDLSLGILPFEDEMVERSILVEIGMIKVRLPTPEDLIILKAIAHRPKDLEDIRAIKANYQNLDHERIRSWLMQFGDALDQPGLWEEINAKL